MRSNDQVAALLYEYAELIALTGGDAFRARTYEKAARAIGGHHADLADTDPTTIPGVGASTAAKVAEALATGTFRQLEDLRAKVPAGVRQLADIPGVGPKKAVALYRELGISNIDELERALDGDKLAGLRGFGRKTADNIRAGIALLRGTGGRVTMDVALALARQVLDALPVERKAYAGSLRRGRETIGDVDILAASTEPGPVMAAFTALPFVTEVIAHGEKKTSVRTTAGLQVDLRVVPPESWGAALQYFTGSKAHNVAVREIAVSKGLKLSEYGLFDAESGDLIVADTEEAVYARLGLDWVPPALREDTGEVQAARRHELPRLVELADLRGDLHTHTNLTDGVAPMSEMVAAAAARGYEWYAVTDHAPELYMQRMTLEKARAQRAALRDLQARTPGIRLLHGSELNIAPDGSVDWPEEILAEFDICVASVHSAFTLPRDVQTRRVVRAIENPRVHVIGHLTGRLIGRREPIDLDLDAVFAAAARTGTVLEVNGGPDRLDLRDEHIRWAKRHGVRFAIDSDAHSVPQLGFVEYAVRTAQRGWLTPDDVVNTWDYERVGQWLRLA